MLRADVRVIAATNRDLRGLVGRGGFREDLFYRLNVFEIALPPLRERADDILRLAAVFLEDAAASLGRPRVGPVGGRATCAAPYAWPGNVRELRNAMERAAILADGGLVTSAHLNLRAISHAHLDQKAAPRLDQGVNDPAGNAFVGSLSASAFPPREPDGRPPPHRRLAPRQPVTAPGSPALPPLPSIAQVERTLVQQALVACRYNKTAAAKALGLTRTQFYVRLKKYGIDG